MASGNGLVRRVRLWDFGEGKGLGLDSDTQVWILHSTEIRKRHFGYDLQDSSLTRQFMSLK